MVTKNVRMALAIIVLTAAGSAVQAQTTTQSAVDPQIEDVLKTLHDRRDTLKDFSAKLDYSVYHPKTYDTEGKRGDIVYINDPKTGPTFEVKFAINTLDGKAHAVIQQTIAFDGTNITLIDYKAKTYHQENAIPPGGKPGDAVSLKGAVPIPIGLDPKEVQESFDVTKVSDDANTAVLQLKPKEAGKYEFTQVDVTVDKKLQLPVKVVQKMRNTDEVTFEFKDVAVNGGKAAIEPVQKPTEPGWQIEEK